VFEPSVGTGPVGASAVHDHRGSGLVCPRGRTRRGLVWRWSAAARASIPRPARRTARSLFQFVRFGSKIEPAFGKIADAADRVGAVGMGRVVAALVRQRSGPHRCLGRSPRAQHAMGCPERRLDESPSCLGKVTWSTWLACRGSRPGRMRSGGTNPACGPRQVLRPAHQLSLVWRVVLKAVAPWCAAG